MASTTVLPDTDVTTEWTPSAGTDHFELVNEVIPGDDSEYIEAIDDPADSEQLVDEFRFTGIAEGFSSAVKTHIRYELGDATSIIQVDYILDGVIRQTYNITGVSGVKLNQLTALTAAHYSSERINAGSLRLTFIP